MKVVPAVREGEPEEGRSSGGYRAGGGLNHHCSPRTRERRKALEAGTVPWRRWVKLRAGGRCKRQEGNGGRRARAASREGKTLKSEPWTWQRGETTRKIGGGGSRRGRAKRRGRNGVGLGRPRSWTPPVDVAMREGSPWEVLGSAERAVIRETLEGRKAHGRMNPLRKPWGTAVDGRPRGRVGNDERRGGIR